MSFKSGKAFNENIHPWRSKKILKPREHSKGSGSHLIKNRGKLVTGFTGYDRIYNHTNYKQILLLMSYIKKYVCIIIHHELLYFKSEVALLFLWKLNFTDLHTWWNRIWFGKRRLSEQRRHRKWFQRLWWQHQPK